MVVEREDVSRPELKSDSSFGGRPPVHLRLTVVSGPATGRQVGLAPGEALRVGRVHGSSDWVIPDPLLAPCHLALEYDSGEWIARDPSHPLQRHPSCQQHCFADALRNSPCHESICQIFDRSLSSGLYLNNTHIVESTLVAGDVIVLGTTAITIESGVSPFTIDSPTAHTGAGDPPIGGPPLYAPTATAVMNAIATSSLPLYGILDAARSPAVLELLRTHSELYYSLYDTPYGDELDECAPYLVALPPHSPLLRDWISLGWGRSWGVLLRSPLDFRSLRKHLRKFLKVTTESGRNLYFRFYDPRVLRTFLSSSNSSELDAFFGPIQDFVVETSDGSELYVLSRNVQKAGEPNPYQPGPYQPSRLGASLRVDTIALPVAPPNAESTPSFEG